MADDRFEYIPLDKVKVQKHNVRINNIGDGIDDLAENIKVNGLLQPVAAYYDSNESIYVILTGQRRLNAFHYLNERYPDGNFDKIQCKIIPEPPTDEKKKALSIAENITQLPMTNPDLIKAVTDLFNTYNDYEMVQQEFGLTEYMVNKYVRLARLPEEVKVAIREGEIHSNPKTAENVSIRAVDSLNYTKNGPIPVEKVIELAKEMGKTDTDLTDIVKEVPKGGSISDIVKRAKNKQKQRFKVDLSSENAEKLHKVAELNGESVESRATQYVIDGTEKDYDQLGD